MSKIIPFFINSNLCTEKDDIKSLENFKRAIAYNIGNSYITWSLIKQLQGDFVTPYQIKNIWQYDFSKQDKDIDIINNECTHVFLILQDQVRIVEGYNQTIPFENLTQFISKLNKPVTVLSLGINQYFDYDYSENRFIKTNLEPEFHKKLNNRLVNFLQFLSHHTNTIGVRGVYTQEIFAKLGIENTQIIGCPSFYENGEGKYVEKKEFTQVNNILMLAPWLQSEYHNCHSISGKKLNFIIQDEHYFLNKIFENKVYTQEINKNELINWQNKAYRTFSAIKDWKNFCKTQDFAFGYRIHGSIMATNCNLPVLFFAPDIKGTEMAQYLNIPYTHKGLNNLSIQEMYELSNFEPHNSNYNKLFEEYKSFLHKNNLKLYCENLEEYNYNTQPSLIEKPIIFKRYRRWYDFVFSIYATERTRTFIIFGIKITLKRKRKK